MKTLPDPAALQNRKPPLPGEVAPPKRRGKLATALWLTGLLAGSVGMTGCCSPAFHRAWKASDRAERWEGRWESDRPGTGGRLRAVVHPEPDGHVKAYFEARWKCFVSAYEVVLEARRGKGGTLLSGEHLLQSCVGGGLYRYQGLLTEHELKARYESHHDKGVFRLEPSSALHPPCTP